MTWARCELSSQQRFVFSKILLLDSPLPHFTWSSCLLSEARVTWIVVCLDCMSTSSCWRARHATFLLGPSSVIAANRPTGSMSSLQGRFYSAKYTLKFMGICWPRLSGRLLVCAWARLPRSCPWTLKRQTRPRRNTHPETTPSSTFSAQGIYSKNAKLNSVSKN